VTRYSPAPTRSAGESDGVEGNGRLTATTGTLLTLLLLLEGFTILDVRGYITLHTAVGLILIGPVVLKCASTVYRFARYYTGRADYVRKGPPHLVLRLIGPFVVLSTLAVLGTGVALLIDKGRSGTWVTLHQASFIVWVALMAVHFLGHLAAAATETARELRRRTDDPARRGKALRWTAVTVSLLIGVGLATAFTPAASAWQMHDHNHSRFHRG
jgi:hypothetical protein